MNVNLYYALCCLLTIGILIGIAMMSKVESAKGGNLLSALCTAAAILLTLFNYGILTRSDLWICLAIASIIGLWAAQRVQMIQMPQVVALLNGFGGAASALVAVVSLCGGQLGQLFSLITAGLALAVGVITFTGSLIAAGKLHKVLSQRPVIWPAHQLITILAALASCGSVALFGFSQIQLPLLIGFCILVSGLFGVAFSIRVGGADMPITISLLNSLSGVAGAIAGMAISDLLLVSVGGVVGASGLLLTQIMCRAMNRSLMDILLGKTSVPQKSAGKDSSQQPESVPSSKPLASDLQQNNAPEVLLTNAKKVAIVPGYGMALAQAQSLVKQLADTLEARGTEVFFAIHPVAGRMPGHMNVLLCEVDVPYEKLHEMEEVNPWFSQCDVAVVIGANDVINPAANTAEGTPIYGMPVLDVAAAKHVIVCNYDLKPGYAGVENPLYSQKETVTLLLGDAKETLSKLIEKVGEKTAASTSSKEGDSGKQTASILKSAKKVAIVPGYGMALAQAQSLVKQLADTLEARGTEVFFAIHPVAGRMPGHMNVLLCEVDVPYEKLHEMEEVNPWFSQCDVAVVIGANDVINPAANTAEGTPIYGMPVLDVAAAKHVIVCNYDLKPGYAGVENPLYSQKETVTLLLGDAKETLTNLINAIR